MVVVEPSGFSMVILLTTRVEAELSLCDAPPLFAVPLVPEADVDGTVAADTVLIAEIAIN